MVKKKLKRNKILVKRALQIKFAVVILLAMLVTTITAGADFYYSLLGFIKGHFNEIPQLELFIANVNQLVYAKIVVLIIIAFFVSFFISHRIAGPIYKLETELDKLSRGDLRGKIKLRKRDSLKRIFKYLNKLIENFNMWIKKDREKIKHIEHKLGGIKKKNNNKEINREIEEIQTMLEEISNKWKTPE